MSAAALKPKSAKPGGSSTARVPVQHAAAVAEPDPAALLPGDLPSACPFASEWQPVVFAVQAAEGVSLPALRDAFQQLRVLQHLSLPDLAARLDPADALSTELQAAAAAPEGASLPVSAAAKLLERQFSKERGLAWKFELVRRREALATAEPQAQAAEAEAAAAASAHASAANALAAVKARLPQPPPAQTSDAAAPPADAAEAGREEDADSNDADELDDAAAGAASAPPKVPPLPLHQLAAAAAEVVLSPEQRRALTEAQAVLQAADKGMEAASAAAAAAGAALQAARSGMDAPHSHYEPYVVEGLPTTAAGLSAAIAAGVPLRAVVWMHPAAAAGVLADASASQAGTRPPSAAMAGRASSGGGAAPTIAAAADPTVMPSELQQLQAAVDAACWDSELSALLVLALALGDVASPFTTVPACSTIVDPPWAAASSAAAAAARAAAAAAPEAKQALSSSGDKAGSAASSAGTKGTASSGGGTAGRPGSYVPGGGSSAAAAAPEEVPGCKELARLLLSASKQARRFDEWRRRVRVYRMPAPESGSSSSSSSMSYYSHLLDSVPAERQSVPLVLHAMLEQVCQSSVASGESHTDAEQLLVAAQAEDAIAAAFSALVDDQAGFLTPPAPAKLPGLSLVYQGDDLAAAAHGLTSGYVRCSPPPKDRPEQGSVSAGANSQWPFAARGLSSSDVDAVEQNMLGLLQLPGLDAFAAADSSVEGGQAADIAQQIRQAELKCLCPEGLPVAAVQRCQLLQAAAAMLPSEVAAAHAQGILSRHHHEPLQPQLLRQALWKASMELPGAASQHWGPGAELVAFFAGGAGLEQSLRCSMPRAVTFQQFWRLLLAGGCCQPEPELQDKVFEMSQAAAEHACAAWRRALLYTDAGAIVSTGTDGLLSLSQGPTTLRLLPADASSAGSSQLMATFQGGAAASVSCWTAPAADGYGRAAQPSEASAPALQEASSGASSTPADEAGGVMDEAAAPEGTPGTAQAVPDVGSGLCCSVVSLVTPQGLVVQMRSDGCVLLAPVQLPEAQVLQSLGASVLGAPLAAGQLNTQLPAGPFALHAVLADGTLVKAAAAAAAATATHRAADSGVLQQCRSSSRLAILHPDGSTSKHHALQVQPQGTTLPPVAVDGWLLTTPQGEQSWTADAAALEQLEAELAAAEAAAVAAAAAAEAAAAAAAAAAEAAPGKKGSKGEKDRAKGISKHGGISTKRPEQPGGAAVAEAAFATEGAMQAGTQQLDEEAIAAIRDALAELLQQQPVSQGRIRAACLTDPDTQAVVTTREDHLLLIEYADGSKLLQDAEGCRVSFVGCGWVFEGAAMPAVRSDTAGIMVEPCPGLTLTWRRETRVVTCSHSGSGAALCASPTGYVACSGAAAAPSALSAFTAAVLQAGPRWQQQPRQLQPEQQQWPLLQDADAATHAASGADSMPPALALLPAVQEEGGGPDAAELEAGVKAPAADEASSVLIDACAQEACWGLLGVDLLSQEAVMIEAGQCRLYAAAGSVKVWHTGWSPPEAAQAGASQPGDVDAVADAVAEQSSSAVTEVSTDSTRPAAALDDADDEDADDEAAAHGQAAAAAAEAAQAAHAAAEEAAAAEAAAAAARAAPKPIAAGIQPRLFVVDSRSGSGYEVLAPGAVVVLQAATAQGHRHLCEAALGADEPGTVCHTFLASHSPRGPGLQPLPLAQPPQVVAAQVNAGSDLLCLRRATTVEPAVQRAGLLLPRVAALNPWSQLAGGSAAAAGGARGLPATRVAAAAAGSSSGQVVVVREVLELPVLSPEVQEQAAAVVAAWEAQRAQWADDEAAATTRTDVASQGSQEASEVAALLQSAGFTTIAAADPAAAADQAPASAAGCCDQSRSSSVGGGRLSCLKQSLGSEVQVAAAAAAAQAEAAAAAAAAAAAEAAARQPKPRRPHPGKVGPFDHTPQKPQPHATLKYFDTQEGQSGAAAVARTRHQLPPPPPVQAASAGKQQVPGVYLANSTALARARDDGEAEGAGYDQGLAALAGARAVPSSVSAARSSAGRLTAAVSPPRHTPLMHAGKPTKQRAQQQQPAPLQEEALLPPLPGLAGQHQTEDASGSADVAAIEAAGSSGTGSNSSTRGGGRLGLYGQPRVPLPPLPATYSKSQAAGEPNAAHLTREGDALRATKTSSASLIRASGKAGQQVVVSPAHLSFGTLTVGSVAHRTARLLNGSPDVLRYTVLRPQLPLRVLRQPAPLAPGLESAFTVELRAEQPGDFEGEVVVTTEHQRFTLTVSAKLLAAAQEVVPSAGDVAAGGDALPC